MRVFQGGTDAVTRVLVEFADKEGTRWSTVGVSANIIDASFQALTDAITYKLFEGWREVGSPTTLRHDLIAACQVLHAL